MKSESITRRTFSQRIRAVRKLVLIAAAAFDLGRTANADLFTTFDGGASGWTANGGEIAYRSTGGYPGGFIAVTDVLTGAMTVSPPAAFLGNLSAYLNGTISFAAKNLNGAAPNTTSSTPFGFVRIFGPGGSTALALTTSGQPAADGRWRTYSAPLSPSVWSGNLATMLSNVTAITIVLESHNGAPPEEIGFDNFRLTVGETSSNQIIWMGDQSSCALGDYPAAGSFHSGFWRNFIVPGPGDQAVFNGKWPGPGPEPLYWFLNNNTTLAPHNIYFGDFYYRPRGVCPESFTAGRAVTLASLLFKGTARDFYFKSATGPIDTARLTVTGLTQVGTQSSGASLTINAGTMTSGSVYITGPLPYGPKRPTSRLTIAENAVLVSPSVVVGKGGELVGRQRVRGSVSPASSFTGAQGGEAPAEPSVIGSVYVNEGRVSPGVLTVAGNFYLENGGELELAVGGVTPGETYDQVIADGETVLSGTVRIAFVNGFAPQAGDSYSFFGTAGFDASAATIVTDPGVAIAEFGSPGSQTLQVVAIPTPSADYQQWRQANFGNTTSREGEPTANLDGDEAQNFFEFLFNLDPNAPDYHTLEAGVGSSGVPVALVVQSGGVQRAAFEFIRHKRFGPYVIEASSDLETWTLQTPVVDSVVSVSDDYERVRVLDVSLPQDGSSSKRFLRISVAR